MLNPDFAVLIATKIPYSFFINLFFSLFKIKCTFALTFLICSLLNQRNYASTYLHINFASGLKGSYLFHTYFMVQCVLIFNYTTFYLPAFHSLLDIAGPQEEDLFSQINAYWPFNNYA